MCLAFSLPFSFHFYHCSNIFITCLLPPRSRRSSILNPTAGGSGKRNIVQAGDAGGVLGWCAHACKPARTGCFCRMCVPVEIAEKKKEKILHILRLPFVRPSVVALGTEPQLVQLMHGLDMRGHCDRESDVSQVILATCQACNAGGTLRRRTFSAEASVKMRGLAASRG